MDAEIVRQRVKEEWKRDKTVNIPLKTAHLLEGAELMRQTARQRFIDAFTEAVNKRPKEKGFTRGMFGLDEKEILALIDKL